MQIKYLFLIEIDNGDKNIAYPVLDYSNPKGGITFKGENTVNTREEFNKKLKEIVYSDNSNSIFALDGSYRLKGSSENIIGKKKIKKILFKNFCNEIEILKDFDTRINSSRIYFKLKSNFQILIEDI